jgi:hypothetical protein
LAAFLREQERNGERGTERASDEKGDKRERGARERDKRETATGTQLLREEREGKRGTWRETCRRPRSKAANKPMEFPFPSQDRRWLEESPVFMA